MRSGGSGGFR